MNIIINDTNITLQTDDGTSSHILLTKPDIADYGNVTTRPLVKSYHLVRETIWERFCECVQEINEHCRHDIHCDCYLMTFGPLYTALLSNSQAKNILYYGKKEASSFLSSLQDFMTFLQADSSLVSLPLHPLVFSGLANGSWHAIVMDLDAGCNIRTVCDAITKVRKGGILLLYTALDAPADDMAGLLHHAVKTAFSSCTLYTFTMEPSLCELLYPYSAEALVLTYTEELLTHAAKVNSLTQNILQGEYLPEDCRYAMELLTTAEKDLLALYDYLEDPCLPVYANTLKEALMDCCIGLSDGTETQVYLDKLRLAAQIFFTAIESEF